MTVTWQAAGAYDTGTSSCAPGLPASTAVGDLLIIGCAFGNGNDMPLDTPSGWTLIPDSLEFGGDGLAYGTDSGNRGVMAFMRIADGTEGATVTVTNPGSGANTRVTQAQIMRFTKTEAEFYVSASNGEDNTDGTGYSVTADSVLIPANGDQGIAVTAWNPDSATAGTPTLTWDGVADTCIQAQTVASTQGADCRFLIYRRNLAGTGGSAPVFATTAGASVSGATAFILIHDGAASTVEGAGTATLPAATASGAGSVIDTGDGAATLPSAIASGAGTITTTGAGAASVPAATASGAGTLTTTGASTATLPAATATGTGDVTEGEEATTGAGAATLPAATVTGAATVTTDGAGVATLPAATTVGAGTVTVDGTSSATLPALTSNGTGSVLIAGTAAADLPALTAAAEATYTINGTGAATLPPLTGTGTDSTPRDVTVNSIVEHVRSVAATEHERAVVATARPRSLVAADRQRGVTVTEHPRATTITDRS